MSELEIIKYLLQEIEQEIEYNKNYEIEKEKAKKEADESPYIWWNYMPSTYQREPRKSVIKANAKLMRRLLLKVGGNNEM